MPKDESMICLLANEIYNSDNYLVYKCTKFTVLGIFDEQGIKWNNYDKNFILHLQNIAKKISMIFGQWSDYHLGLWPDLSKQREHCSFCYIRIVSFQKFKEFYKSLLVFAKKLNLTTETIRITLMLMKHRKTICA